MRTFKISGTRAVINQPQLVNCFGKDALIVDNFDRERPRYYTELSTRAVKSIQFLREAKAPLIQAMLFVKRIILQSSCLWLWTICLVSGTALRTPGIVSSIYLFFGASDRECIPEDGLGRLVILWSHN